MTLKRSLLSSSLNTGDRFHLFNATSQYNYLAGTASGTTSSGLLTVTFGTPFATIPSISLNLAQVTNVAAGLSAINVTTTGFQILAFQLEGGTTNGLPIANTSITVDWIAVSPIGSATGISAGYTSAITTDVNGSYRVNFPVAYTSTPIVVTTHRDNTSFLAQDNTNHFVSAVDLNGFVVTFSAGENGDLWRSSAAGQLSWVANPPASTNSGFSSGSVTTANSTVSPSYTAPAGFGTTYTGAPIVCAGWGSLPEPVGTNEPGAEIYITSKTTTGFTAQIETYEGSLPTFTRTYNWIAAVPKSS